ncbi:unnamed protein product, partial [Sphacelaria rigidula]
MAGIVGWRPELWSRPDLVCNAWEDRLLTGPYCSSKHLGTDVFRKQSAQSPHQPRPDPIPTTNPNPNPNPNPIDRDVQTLMRSSEHVVPSRITLPTIGWVS